jgi:hypothetical protein
MNICGLDVCRNYAVICLVDRLPETSPLQFFGSLKSVQDWQKKFIKQKVKKPLQINSCSWVIPCNKEGIDLLKSLEIDEIILEPTGYWYSGFWINATEQLGIKLNWISHQHVKYKRAGYGFKNKDDVSDAFTMALAYFDRTSFDELGNPPFIKHYSHKAVEQLRRTWFEREQLDKQLNVWTNQLRQRLCIEFPEIAQKDFGRPGVAGYNRTLAHIAGIRLNPRVQKVTAGTGIMPYTQRMANDLMDHQQRLNEHEQMLNEILMDDHFREYHRTFVRFGYSIVMQSLILLHVYPLERFFVNGKPYWKNNHDLSLRKFQAYLGLAYTYEKSGDTSAKDNKVKKKWFGSDLVRSHLYPHALTTICNPKSHAKSAILLKLRDSWFNDREVNETYRDNKGRKQIRKVKHPSFQSLGKDGICRLLFYETRLLYQELREAVK